MTHLSENKSNMLSTNTQNIKMYTITKCHGQYIYHLPGLEQELQSLGRLQINCDWHE